jgi:hypothetical protein
LVVDLSQDNKDIFGFCLNTFSKIELLSFFLFGAHL